MERQRWITHSQQDARRARIQLAQFVSTLPNDETYKKLRSYFNLGERNGTYRHNTDRSYDSDQRQYIIAAANAQVEPLCPTNEFWRDYFTAYATEPLESGQPRRASTSYRASYGICRLFDQHGLPSPTRTSFHRELLVRVALSDSRSTRKARPLLSPASVGLVESYDGASLASLRDKAIAAVGTNRGFRASTIVDLRIQDLSFDERGVSFGVRENKGNRTGEVIPTASRHSTNHRACMVCALQALRDALALQAITSGPLFRAINRWGQVQSHGLCPKSVTLLLRKGLAHAGIPEANSYSSHSYRHGVVHTAVAQRLSLEEIQLITLHRSIRGLKAYISAIDPWYFAARQLDVLGPTITPSHGSGFVHAG